MSSFNIDIHKLPEFDSHRVVSIFSDSSNTLQGFVAIHRGGLQRASFGATRLWTYGSPTEAIRDVLRLSRIMTYKSALAGLGYGGAKAVIFPPHDSNQKRELLNTYASYVNYFGGSFVTGADVGVSQEDVIEMAKHSKHIVGMTTDPVLYTGMGVAYSLNACLKEVFHTEQYEHRSFAIQGLGKTGQVILEKIYSTAENIYVSDINEEKVEFIKTKYPKVHVVSFQEIYKQHVDVFMPCALSGAIHIKNVSKLHCSIIVGSANSQLENDEIGDILYKLGIVYAPDYVANAGGLISVVDEYKNGKANEERIIKRVKNIGNTLENIITKSKELHKPTNRVANEMAKEISTSFI